MNMTIRLALSVAVVGAVTATTLGQAVGDTPAPSAAASGAANPGFLTHFTPTVPNPTTASAAQLAAGRPVGAFATLTADSSAGGSISRAEVIARAQSWVDAGVPYSMTSYRTDANGKYRTDCSGFVSMAWHLNSSSGNNWGETTGTLLNYTSSIPKESLKPGDVLLNPDSGAGGHVVIFNGWTSSDHSTYDALEESGSSGAVHHSIPYPYYSGHGTFSPRRYDNIQDANNGVDVTGDGKADLMVLSTDGTIGLRPGSGTSFGAGTTVSAGWQNFLGGAGQGRLYYADINGDGNKDLLVQGTDGTIGVRFNNGSGTSFGANVPLSSGWQNYLSRPGQGRLTFPDINGDGKADLVIQGTDGTIATHLGSGTSFGANIPLSSGWQNYLSQPGQGRLTFPDINGDGKADLVIQGTDGTIATHLGSGTSFGANIPLSSGWQNYLSQPGQGRLTFPDINGDGKADLVIQGTDGTIATHLGSGTSFGANIPLSSGWQNYLSQPGQGTLSFE
ncbi:FG-GAP-like repeat-containing protein [Streptomyces virginiae]|uniref:FG-GAP-like repeat-containing protein n=1 Tax=Streptomyces virginiae TaxID=1961 RepID=A0ABZ1TNS7_STRVG|nr:FG-GAP-like repeat-containing protein [Streptomyces virginiae]